MLAPSEGSRVLDVGRDLQPDAIAVGDDRQKAQRDAEGDEGHSLTHPAERLRGRRNREFAAGAELSGLAVERHQIRARPSTGPD